jgi:hypothetical protein
MGLSVALQNENGNPIDIVLDPKNYLHRLLPSHDDESYQCLRFIDWYGDTVFNHLQMPTFLSEWQRLNSKVKSDEERQLLSRIEKLAYDCQSEQHVYLKFIGD